MHPQLLLRLWSHVRLSTMIIGIMVPAPRRHRERFFASALAA